MTYAPPPPPVGEPTYSTPRARRFGKGALAGTGIGALLLGFAMGTGGSSDAAAVSTTSTVTSTVRETATIRETATVKETATETVTTSASATSTTAAAESTTPVAIQPPPTPATSAARVVAPPVAPSPSPARLVASRPAPAPVVATPAPAPEPAPAYFASCAEARAAGAAPLLRGQPGYRAKLDRDGDGVACEG